MKIKCWNWVAALTKSIKVYIYWRSARFVATIIRPSRCIKHQHLSRAIISHVNWIVLEKSSSICFFILRILIHFRILCFVYKCLIMTGAVQCSISLSLSWCFHEILRFILTIECRVCFSTFGIQNFKYNNNGDSDHILKAQSKDIGFDIERLIVCHLTYLFSA